MCPNFSSLPTAWIKDRIHLLLVPLCDLTPGTSMICLLLELYEHSTRVWQDAKS